jgi:hypothetical protein
VLVGKIGPDDLDDQGWRGGPHQCAFTRAGSYRPVVLYVMVVLLRSFSVCLSTGSFREDFTKVMVKEPGVGTSGTLKRPSSVAGPV